MRISLNGQQLSAGSLGFVRVGSPALHSTSPSSGPIGGGTHVLIAGASLSGGDDYRCRFGQSVVPATYSAGSVDDPWLPISTTHPGGRIRCTSPDAMETGTVVLQVSLNAQQYAGKLAYTYHGGVVVLGLSPNSGPELGSTHVVVSGKELELGSHYVCRFNATVVPARGLDASSIDCTSPAAADAGLAPVHVSLNAQQFVGNASEETGFTYYVHSVVSEVSPTSGPRAGGTLVNVSGVGFADGSHYICAFGAQLVPASFAYSENAGLGGASVISCYSPAVAEGGAPVALEVSLNAQQYTVEAHGFRYHGLPVVSGFSPSSGPAVGATLVVVSGGAFDGGSDYRCRWGGCGSCATEWSCGACVVNGTFGEGEGGEQTVTCESPSLAGVEAGASAAAVLLEVSLNSQEYTASNASGGRVPVSGRGPEGWAELLYEYYAPPVMAGVSPALGPHEGATALRLSGSALGGAGSHLKCRFNRSETAATLDAGSAELRCASAAAAAAAVAAPGNATLQVSLNGQQFEASVVQYGYHEQVEVLSLSPSAGPAVGGTTVVVSGLRLDIGDTITYPDYRCAFGDTCASCGWSTPTLPKFWGGKYSAGCDCTTVVPATLTHGGTALTCVTPTTVAGSPAVEVSLNAQDYSNSSVPFGFLPPVAVSAVGPPQGPYAGGTFIRVAGLHLGGGPDARCRFVNGTDGALVTTPASYEPLLGTLACYSPTAVRPPMHSLCLYLPCLHLPCLYLLSLRFYAYSILTTPMLTCLYLLCLHLPRLY